MAVSNLTITSITDDDNGIAESQTPGGAGDLILNGALVTDGVASFDAAQPVTIESAGNDSGVNFTVTGTYGGRIQTETLAGGNATSVNTSRYFNTVSSISVDAATAGAVFAGVLASNGAATAICRLNYRSRDFKVGLYGEILNDGSLTWKVEHTPDNPQLDAELTWLDHADLTSQTTNADGNYAFRVQACRGVITDYINGGYELTVVED